MVVKMTPILSPCAYCNVRAGRQTDHLINKNQARRRPRAAAMRDDRAFKVPACRECNEAKATRLLVPESHRRYIPELEALTGGVYAVWHGDAESLRRLID